MSRSKSIDFICPVCQTKMVVPNNVMGRKVRCPKCMTKSVAQEGARARINPQVYILAGALLAIVVFCVVMSFVMSDSGSVTP